MGFWRGFILGLPFAIYLGEKNLAFPITYKVSSTNEEVDLKINMKFASMLLKDIG